MTETPTITGTATLVQDGLDICRGHGALYRVDPPLAYQDGNDEPATAELIIVSFVGRQHEPEEHAIVRELLGLGPFVPETAIFVANAAGEPEIDTPYVVEAEEEDFAGALALAGYAISQ